jgi:pimeloyl-ACP methyl ester carboxylesterase
MVVVTMPFARTSDGVEIAYQVAGAGPTTVLFMHGWAGSGSYFNETLEHLDRMRLRAITFDFRGHGDSQLADAYGLDELTADTIAVADAAQAAQVVLVGFSMSGKFAQHVSAVHRDRVLGQILVAGCPTGEMPLPPELLADWYACAGNAERMAVLAEPFMTQPVARETLEEFGRQAARVPLAALQGTLEAAMFTSFEAVPVPTLVLGGLHDTMFAPDMMSEGVAAAIPGATLKLLDCGHEIPIEQPLEFAALIDAFVAQVGEGDCGGCSPTSVDG